MTTPRKRRTARTGATRVTVVDLDADQLRSLRMEQLLAEVTLDVNCTDGRCPALKIAGDACRYCRLGGREPLPKALWDGLWPDECPGHRSCAAHRRSSEACKVCDVQS